jgi:uncharacterized protein RhaS with RHS repeats
MYSPTLGRFLSTDPIGYGDGMNWYNYVGGDPVNGRDPSGMFLASLDGLFSIRENSELIRLPNESNDGLATTTTEFTGDQEYSRRDYGFRERNNRGLGPFPKSLHGCLGDVGSGAWNAFANPEAQVAAAIGSAINAINETSNARREGKGTPSATFEKDGKKYATIVPGSNKKVSVVKFTARVAKRLIPGYAGFSAIAAAAGGIVSAYNSKQCRALL